MKIDGNTTDAPKAVAAREGCTRRSRPRTRMQRHNPIVYAQGEAR